MPNLQDRSRREKDTTSFENSEASARAVLFVPREFLEFERALKHNNLRRPPDDSTAKGTPTNESYLFLITGIPLWCLSLAGRGISRGWRGELQDVTLCQRDPFFGAPNSATYAWVGNASSIRGSGA